MPLSSRSTRLARLVWFTGLLLLSLMSIASVAVLATGMPLPGVLAVALCGAAWWAMGRSLLRAKDAANPGAFDVRARLRRLIPALPEPPVPLEPTVALTVNPTAHPSTPVTPDVSSTAMRLPPWPRLWILAAGAAVSVSAGVVLARALPDVPAWVFFLAVVAGSVGVVIGGNAWQLMRETSTADAMVGMAWIASAVGVFAFTRLADIADFPIYFFSDEAIHTVRAMDLLNNGLRDTSDRLLPPYFNNGAYWNLSLSVYVQAVSMALFGKSAELARATFAFFAVLGAGALGLATKLAFRQRWPWLAVLFLTATPAWFLHSRTAFEASLMVSCYSGFLLFYLLYRVRDPRFLPPAVVCGALTFYAYTNGQAIMVFTGAALLVIDWRYHLRHWRIGLAGAGLIVLLALPYARFRAEHPDAMASQLRILDSYWFLPTSLGQKLGRFAVEYLGGLNPLYWFLPNNQDLARHVMPGYGHIGFWALPLFAAGLYVCVRNLQSPAHRVALVALLAAPFGAALVEIAVTRALAYVVPAALLCALGAEWLIGMIPAERTRAVTVATATLALVSVSVWMWRDARVNGPVWHGDYGLYGMQWGARQLFAEEIPAFLREHPSQRLVVSPSWANGTDVFLRFFDVDVSRVQLLNIDHYLRRRQPLDDAMTFVMLNDEIERANGSGKFAPLRVERVIPAPDGGPQFTFARLRYVNDVDAVFARELAAQQRPVTRTVLIDGEPAHVSHSRLDMGRSENLFDGDTFTLVRGEGANPFVVDVTFDLPRRATGVEATFAKMDFSVKVVAYGADGSRHEYSGTYRDLPGEPNITLDFGEQATDVMRLRLEVTQINPPEDVHIHVRELKLR